jgi:hypothetical protein
VRIDVFLFADRGRGDRFGRSRRGRSFIGRSRLFGFGNLWRRFFLFLLLGVATTLVTSSFALASIFTCIEGLPDGLEVGVTDWELFLEKTQTRLISDSRERKLSVLEAHLVHSSSSNGFDRQSRNKVLLGHVAQFPEPFSRLSFPRLDEFLILDEFVPATVEPLTFFKLLDVTVSVSTLEAIRTLSEREEEGTRVSGEDGSEIVGRGR